MSKITSLKLTNRVMFLDTTLVKKTSHTIDLFHQLRLLLGNETRVLFNRNDRGHGTISAGFCQTVCHSFLFTAFRNLPRTFLCYLGLFSTLFCQISNL